MGTRFIVRTGMAYPTDPAVDAALRQIGQEAIAAAVRAKQTKTAADIQAAHDAEQRRLLAVQRAFVEGALREVVPGDVVDDVPEGSLPWLLEQGHLVPHEVKHEITEDEWADLGRPSDRVRDLAASIDAVVDEARAKGPADAPDLSAE